MKNHIKSVHISEDSNTVKWAHNVFGVFEDVQFETLAKEDEKIVDDVSEETEEIVDEPETMDFIFLFCFVCTYTNWGREHFLHW